MRRPHISTATKVSVAMQQTEFGWINCPFCKDPLTPHNQRILEHLVPHELGGSSEVENLRWIHKECAAKKTNGNKATVAGGDIHKIAKAKRLARAKDAHDAIVAGNAERPEGKMQSRPFQGSRKFNGQAKWREK